MNICTLCKKEGAMSVLGSYPTKSGIVYRYVHKDCATARMRKYRKGNLNQIHSDSYQPESVIMEVRETAE